MGIGNSASCNLTRSAEKNVGAVLVIIASADTRTRRRPPFASVVHASSARWRSAPPARCTPLVDAAPGGERAAGVDHDVGASSEE
jgi:hypothetical protein